MERCIKVAQVLDSELFFSGLFFGTVIYIKFQF